MTPTEFRTAREATGLTVNALAAWLGISRSTVLRYGSGELLVPVQTAMLLDMLAAGEIPGRFRP